MIAPLLAAAALAVPAAAPKAPPAWELAATAGVVLAADPGGGDRDSRAALGLRASRALPPLLPEPWYARVEAAWLHVTWEGGTDAVNVASTVDTFALPLAAGYEWRDTAGTFWFSPYLAAGPTLIRTAVRYHVDDPRGPAIDRDVAAFEAGAIYGLGARLALPVGEALALSIRAEAVALRRGVADDLALAGALGLLF